jgi:hypothetical protein
MPIIDYYCHLNPQQIADDVSIIDNNFPNDNVMLEFGYALKYLETSKVFMLFNDAYGSTKNLPFDLGFKRQIIRNI